MTQMICRIDKHINIIDAKRPRLIHHARYLSLLILSCMSLSSLPTSLPLALIRFTYSTIFLSSRFLLFLSSAIMILVLVFWNSAQTFSFLYLSSLTVGCENQQCLTSKLTAGSQSLKSKFLGTSLVKQQILQPLKLERFKFQLSSTYYKSLWSSFKLTLLRTTFSDQLQIRLNYSMTAARSSYPNFSQRSLL